VSAPLQVKVYGPAGADVGGALRELSGAETDRLTRAVVSSGAGRIRARAFAAFRAHGIGAAIWGLRRSTGSHFVGPGAKNSTAKASNVIRARVSKGNHAYTVTFSITGLPAMTEEAGQTKPHVIRSAQAHHETMAARHAGKARGVAHARAAQKAGIRKTLAFAIGGGLIYREEVNHPGGPVPKNPFLQPAIAAEAPRIVADWQKALDGFIERVTSKSTTKAAA
jgi:hypothetical protein